MAKKLPVFRKPAENNIFYKFYFAFVLLLIVQVFGIIGFMILEDFSFGEALYMSVIIVSTVGLGAVRDLTPEGRYFVVVLIVVSLSTFTYAFSIITTYIMEGELHKFYKNRKVRKQIEELQDHIIVCGFGRNGKQACEQLRMLHHDFVVIESNTGIVAQLNQSQKTLFIEGDAVHDEVLKAAGIDRARALITTLPNDANNVFVVLTARGLNDKIKIISRASEDSSFNKLKRAGADNVIMPDKIGGVHMASLVLHPDVLEFIDVITGRAAFDLEEIIFKDCKPEFFGKTIGELKAMNVSAANVIGMKSSDGNYLINPPDDTILNKDTKLFVLGTTSEVETLIKLVSK